MKLFISLLSILSAVIYLVISFVFWDFAWPLQLGLVRAEQRIFILAIMGLLGGTVAPVYWAMKD